MHRCTHWAVKQMQCLHFKHFQLIFIVLTGLFMSEKKLNIFWGWPVICASRYLKEVGVNTAFSLVKIFLLLQTEVCKFYEEYWIFVLYIFSWFFWWVCVIFFTSSFHICVVYLRTRELAFKSHILQTFSIILAYWSSVNFAN